MRTLLLAALLTGLVAAPTVTAGGPCDRLYGTFLETEPATWTMDMECRHTVTVDTDCPPPTVKAWTTEEVHPNLTVHRATCRLG